MLMQMLQAGGMPVLSDDERSPDAHNPRGYFEYAPVKRMKKDASWIPLARGKAVKIVSHFLGYLPESEKYNIIFMERTLDEVIASQRKMLRAQGKPEYPGDDAEMRRLFSKHTAHIKKHLAGQANCRALYLDHGRVLANPQQAAEQMAQFLDREMDVEAMAAVVDNSLYRAR